MLRDHPEFPLAEKAQRLADWDHFIRSGFQEKALSPELYHYLVWAWKIGEDEYMPNRASFWHQYFGGEIGSLIEFLNHFLEDTGPISLWDDDDALWRVRFADPIVGDLNRAMYNTTRGYISDLYDAWHRYQDRLLVRLVEKDVAAYARLTPTATAQELNAYGHEVYADILKNHDVYRNPVTDELRTMLAQAAADHDTRLITQPALFAIKPIHEPTSNFQLNAPTAAIPARLQAPGRRRRSAPDWRRAAADPKGP